MKSSRIAIIGMAGRFPGARNLSEFWRNLHDGIESIRDRTDAELIAAGATTDDLANPDYVKRAALLDDVPLFDASFFGFSPHDASIMDPQHRHFLECAWQAIEDAGHPPHYFEGSIGVFAGSGMNAYLIHNLLANRRLIEAAGLFQLKQTGNDKDVLSTRVSYQFDLRGPSINVQTACSTSLVAVHLACESLLNFECDMALAGGVTIEIPHGLGYIHRDGEILSRDGHCRSFDAASTGTVFGSGAGLVVLRRLEDSIEDRDHIRAVILGSAINNDGARKVGYLAPSVEGQAEVIAEALDFAGVNASDISYVETHGTGTLVGDPIEIRALTKAFRKSTSLTSYCAIGSLKSNVGHLDAAAGVSGLIKTVLALEHAQIPPTLHFQNLNPHIDLSGSPFFVNTRLCDWQANGPRRAGVTSLGIGGTNAHVILEEAPRPIASQATRPYQVLTVSAKTSVAADQAFTNLATHLSTHPELSLSDIAYTCHLGRQPFPHRRAVAVRDVPEAIAALENSERKRCASGVAVSHVPEVVFMFSGQGSQYVNMGRELYEHEPVFRETLDRCAQILQQILGINLIQALYPPEEEKDVASENLNQTWLTQPALLSIEYALARWWMSLGVNPTAMVGHSIGEYVAACLAGVFSLEDALAIVVIRGRLIYDLPHGSMLAVPLPPDKLPLTDALSLAAINSPSLCAVSGPTSEIVALEERLAKHSVNCRGLFTSHAFHSSMMDPILKEFEQRLRGFTICAPCIPFFSNVSGTWIKDEEATDPAYWASHIRSTVRFSDSMAELSRLPGKVLMEVGPGNALASLARQQINPATKVLQSLPHPRETVSSLDRAFDTLGQLWVSGIDVDWTTLDAPGSPNRVSLPTYPFARQKFWIEPDTLRPTVASATTPASTAPDSGNEFFYRRVWKPVPLDPAASQEPGLSIVFRDSLGLGDQIVTNLRADRQEVVLVDPGPAYKQTGIEAYSLRPGVRTDYDALFSDLLKSGKAPRRIFHLWSVTSDAVDSLLDEVLQRSFYSPLYLAQALTAQDISNVDMAFVSNRLHQVSGEPIHDPARAVLFGPARVTPKELPGITSHTIDVDFEISRAKECAAQVIAEVSSIPENSTVAYRRNRRFIESVAPLDISGAPERLSLTRGGTYLITGGLGGIGLIVAEHLAREFKARLILVSRSALPPESEWEARVKDAEKSEADKQQIRKLLEIRCLAGGLLVVSADVTNLSQMRDAVDRARKQFGKIDGVFHAAGVLEDSPLMLKTEPAASRVLDPKVRGTLVLEEALRDAPLSCFVLFSSISSILPPPGQVDYAAANAFLDAFALSRKSPVTAINWGAWEKVGMGMQPASSHPLLSKLLLDSPREIVYDSHLSQHQHWVLSEHRLRTGKALLPGTGYLELVAAAFTRGAVEFQDVLFLAPFTVDGSEIKEMRVQLRGELETGQNSGTKRFSVISKQGDWVEHSTGRIAPCTSRPVSRVDRNAISARCHKRQIVFDCERHTRQEQYFDFGHRWQSLKLLHVGSSEGLAELTLDERFSGDLATFNIHPALLDMATGCSLYLTEGYEESGDLYLPFSYKKLSLYHPLPARLFSHIRAQQGNVVHGETVRFDITLFDEQDHVVAEIEGFTMRRIADPAKVSKDRTQDHGSHRPVSEPPIGVTDRPGIHLHDGVRALTRILLADTPAAVIVVPYPIDGLLDGLHERASTRLRAPIASAPIPEAVEGALVSWWQEMLGVDHVDLDDDFFALGGHSLIAVRLFAKIKKAYQVELELAALFEARTVRQLGALVRKLQEPVVSKRRVWDCLIPIQSKGSRVPLFFVHAIGGDVLFYELLAKALGPDQPFYAFRSLLATQEDRRDTTIEELASVYVAEMRSFFPQGPYLIGGLSFGGLVAFEMAQQLQIQGTDAALLAVLDASVPGSADTLGAEAQLSNLWRNLRKDGLRYLTGKFEMKRQYWGQKLLHRAHLMACSCYELIGKRIPINLRYSLMEEIHLRALARYVFRPYSGKITLFRALDRGAESLSQHEDSILGWGPLANRGLEIHDIPATHMNMLQDPQVRVVAEVLNATALNTGTIARHRQPAA